MADTLTTPENTPAIDRLISTLAETLSPEAQARAQKAVFRPRNERPPLISVRNPQGDKDYPRPKLRFTEVYIPYRAEPEDFSWEEIELLNLLEAKEYWITRNDGTRLPLKVHVTVNELTGKDEKLMFVHSYGYSQEQRGLMPPLTTMLREMLGEKAKEVFSMAERQQLVDSGDLPISVGA